MLVVNNLIRLSFRVPALELEDGVCAALTGPSGAGKTQLLRAIADLDPNEGEVSLDGAARAAMPAPDWRRRVTYVAATPAWWADTVRAHFNDPEAARALAGDLGMPGECFDWAVDRLSTGEQQRLALVRAIERHPRILLLDEPTSALDRAAEQMVEALLKRQLEQGVTILMTTHDPAQAERLATRTLRIDGGRLAEVA